MEASQLREHIVKPTLLGISTVIPYSQEAEDLLVGTACVESNCGYYIKQVEGGPAQGIFQMEPDTEDDCKVNYIDFRPELRIIYNELTKQPHPAIFNNYYAAFMARVKYWRASDPLPLRSNYSSLDLYLTALGAYWKLIYNTPLGAGTIEKFVSACYEFGDFE